MDYSFTEGVRFLEKHFTFDNHQLVLAFIENHSELIPHLADSVPYIEKHFPGAERTLTVELDEDDEPGGKTIERLYVLIAAPRNVADAQERMERLDDEWALDLCENTDELVVIDLDYTASAGL